MNNIGNWSVFDECTETPLDMVFPISRRAACLVVRNKNKPLLKTNFFNIQGAVEMTSGLDYHHDNFMRAINRLARIGLQERTDELKCVLLHEVVAYLNRLGQFYYFIKSTFVQKHCARPESIAPTLVKWVIFRQKHSAHRSIDFPKDESEHVQTAQAMSMSSIGGQLFEPKPGHPFNLLEVKTAADLEEQTRNKWERCYRVFQLITDDPNVCHNFSIEREHPVIMQETFAVLEQILK